MNRMKKMIYIEEEEWQELWNLKLQLRHKNFAETMKYLFYELNKNKTEDGK